MIKWKGAGAVTGLIVVGAAGWVAVVKFVLTDSFLVGSILSIVGGMAIGAVIAVLLRSWWLKGLTKTGK